MENEDRYYRNSVVSKAFLKSAFWLAFALVSCLVGFGLRLTELGSQSLWLDEGATYAFAKLPAVELIAATFGREPNPPLYYLLVHAWIGLAGSNEFSLRFLSVLAGVITVALVYRLGRESLSPAAGSGAAVLAAFSPYLIWYSQEARMYSLLAAFATATLLALWWAFQRPTRSAWLGFGLLLLATLYTHFYGVFVLLVAIVFVVTTTMRRRAQYGWWLPLAAHALPVVLYLPWLASNLHSGAAESNWRAPIDFVGLVTRSAQAMAHGGFLSDSLGSALVGVEVLLAAGGIAVAVRFGQGRGWAAGLLLAAIALPSVAVFAISQRQPIFAERYIIAQAPIFYLTLAAGLALSLRRFPPLYLSCLAAIAFVSYTAIDIGWHDARYRKEDFRAAASYIARYAAADDLILLVADYVSMPFGYYYRGPGEVVPFVGNPDRPEEALRPLVEDRQTIWLLLSHSEEVDPKERIRGWLSERYPVATEQFPKGIRLYGYRADYQRPDLPVEAKPLDIIFGNAIRLVGYTVESGVPPTDILLHPPSNWVHVVLYWQASAPVGASYRSSVRIVDERGVWGDKLTRPTEALSLLPTQRWQPGEVVVEDVDVNLNPATPPGEYQLEVRLLDAENQVVPTSGGSAVVGTVEITAR